ncbi:MAG: hypothetical protein QOI83_2172 [Streptomycetaceae bacterium]|nr:hypothetical protein [Streptomycetaceae bacterium]
MPTGRPATLAARRRFLGSTEPPRAEADGRASTATVILGILATSGAAGQLDHVAAISTLRGAVLASPIAVQTPVSGLPRGTTTAGRAARRWPM